METHLLLPDALHARHRLIQSVDGFPASPGWLPVTGHRCRALSLPSCLPHLQLRGVWGHQPPQPRVPQSPCSAAPWCVIPDRATSLLLFPPIDPWQCPSAVSPCAGQIRWGRAPRVPPFLQGPREGEHPGLLGALGGIGVWERGTAGPYLVTCVRVLKSRDLMERSTSMHPMYCEGGHDQSSLLWPPSPARGRRWRGGEEPGVSEKAPFSASSRALTPAHGILTPSTTKRPITCSDPALRPNKLICVLWLLVPS